MISSLYFSVNLFLLLYYYRYLLLSGLTSGAPAVTLNPGVNFASMANGQGERGEARPSHGLCDAGGGRGRRGCPRSSFKEYVRAQGQEKLGGFFYKEHIFAQRQKAAVTLVC